MGPASETEWVGPSQSSRSHQETEMAIRPLSFGIRFKDNRGGRTIRVNAHERDPKRYVLEVLQDGRSKRREHASLSWALRDFASTWRNRLN